MQKMGVLLVDTPILAYFEETCKSLFQAQKPINRYTENLGQFPQLIIRHEAGTDLNTGDAVSLHDDAVDLEHNCVKDKNRLDSYVLSTILYTMGGNNYVWKIIGFKNG